MSANRSRPNIKESPHDGSKYGNSSSHSTPKCMINNVNASNSHKKGPNYPNKSQVFNKDGSKDSTKASLGNDPNITNADTRSPNKDAYKSSFQSIEEKVESKTNDDAKENHDEVGNDKSNLDSPEKRCGPLLPFPSKLPKDDSQRYIQLL